MNRTCCRFALALCVIGLTGCTTFLDQFAASFGQVVTIPQSDPTPPTVTLTVPDLGSGQVTVGSAGGPLTIQLPKGSSFFVVATAEDQGGVQSVGFVGAESWTCRSGRIASQTTGDIASADNAAGAPGGTALTRRWLPLLVDDAYLGM
ncbi:hypothetical protein SB861_40300 [Paraburkholderia sp. SIMBA_049]